MVVTVILYGVQIGDVKIPEWMQVKQRSNHIFWGATLAQAGAHGLVKVTVASTGVDNLATEQIDNGYQLHKGRTLRIFVCEFVTAGGFINLDKPPSLLREAEMMVSALINDLTALSGVQVLAARDPSLDPSTDAAEWIFPTGADDVRTCWRQGMMDTDASWIIAPESGGELERLNREVLDAGRILLGCRPETVATTASKLQTSRLLKKIGVPTIPTFHIDEIPEAAANGWVVKPDDGVGSDDIRLFADRDGMLDCLSEERWEESHIVQPFTAGQPASLSVLCADGRAWLVSVNTQTLMEENNTLHYRGGNIAGLESYRNTAQPIADAIAQALPGLWGYVGVDLIFTENGPLVVEVNPRLTTSYIALSAAIGNNIAGLVLDLLEGAPRFKTFPPDSQPVEIKV